MGRAVYSTCFGSIHTPTSPLIYTLSGGDVGIVTHMTFYVASTVIYGVSGTACQVEVDAGGAVIWSLPASPLPSGIYQWTGREVFNEYLRFDGGGAYTHFRANGYRLTPT